MRTINETIASYEQARYAIEVMKKERSYTGQKIGAVTGAFKTIYRRHSIGDIVLFSQSRVVSGKCTTIVVEYPMTKKQIEEERVRGAFNTMHGRSGEVESSLVRELSV